MCDWKLPNVTEILWGNLDFYKCHYLVILLNFLHNSNIFFLLEQIYISNKILRYTKKNIALWIDFFETWNKNKFHIAIIELLTKGSSMRISIEVTCFEIIFDILSSSSSVGSKQILHCLLFMLLLVICCYGDMEFTCRCNFLIISNSLEIFCP
jgi:hypothetical protein